MSECFFHVNGDTISALSSLCATNQDSPHETYYPPDLRYEEKNGETGLPVAGHAKECIAG